MQGIGTKRGGNKEQSALAAISTFTAPCALSSQVAPKSGFTVPDASISGLQALPGAAALLTLLVRGSAQAASGAATLLTVLARGSARAVPRTATVFTLLARGAAEGVPRAATMRPLP